MPYSTAGKNLMLNALKGTDPTTPITYVGLLTAQTPLTGVTAVASTGIFTKTSHGLSNGDLVILSSLTGGTGLRTAYPYYVIGVSGSTFQLSETSGGAAHAFTVDLSAGTVTKLAEVSGGTPAYARIAIAFNAASEGLLDDSTNGAIVNVPAAGVVDCIGFFSAVTSGTLLAINLSTTLGGTLTEETFGGQGTYTVTDAKLDLNS